MDNFSKPDEKLSPLTSSVEEIQAKLLNKPSSQISSDSLIANLEKAQNEIVILLAMGSFHKFVKSSYYAEYLAERKKGYSLFDYIISILIVCLFSRRKE